jgi:chromosome partitioning protein
VECARVYGVFFVILLQNRLSRLENRGPAQQFDGSLVSAPPAHASFPTATCSEQLATLLAFISRKLDGDSMATHQVPPDSSHDYWRSAVREWYDSRRMSKSAHHGTVITVLNLKGGVGKTHAVWLLASVCQDRGQRLLAIDTDTQGNLSNSFIRERADRAGVESLLNPAAEPDMQNLIVRTAYPHVDIIPSNPSLARFDLSSQRDWEKSDLQRSFVDPIESIRSLYDFVVFDCPPRLSLVSFAALMASDFVIVPLEAADWGAQGIMQVAAAVDHVQQRFNTRLRLLGYLVSRFKRSRLYQQNYLRELRNQFGQDAFDTVIPDLAEFEKSVTDAILLTEHAPRSAEADIARRFFDEVLRRCEKLRPVGSRRGQARVPAAAGAGAR